MYSNGAVQKTSSYQSQDDVNILIDSFKDKLDVEIIESVLINTTYNVNEARNILNDICGFSNQFESKVPTQNSKTRETVTIQKVVNKSYKEKCLDQALEHYHAGYKLFIILRGLPGSGKSHLARSIVRNCNKGNDYGSHIFSTDDYFIKNGVYNYNFKKLTEAHMWNQTRVLRALSCNVNPIIVDNTNTCMWEMRSYAGFGVQYGYVLEVLEPYTSWCFNVKELAHRNKHNVPKDRIRDMSDRYEKNITTDKLLCTYNLKYLYRPVKDINNIQEKNDNINESKNVSSANKVVCVENEGNFLEEATSNDLIDLSSVNTRRIYPELNLETWGVNEDKLNSWGVVLPLNENNEQGLHVNKSENVTDTLVSRKDACTSISEKNFQKSDHEDDVHYLYTKSREINENLPFVERKLMKKFMLDKSSMTEEDYTNDLSEIEDLKKLCEVFPDIRHKYLRDMYLRCNRDINWTLDILTDSNNLEILNFESNMQNNDDADKDEACGIQFEQVDEFTRKKCRNWRDSDITPDNKKLQADLKELNKDLVNKFAEVDMDMNYKTLSSNIDQFGNTYDEATMGNKIRKHDEWETMDNETLKECIEEKIKINRSHYSKNIIKIKKYRGEINDSDIDLISFDEVQDADKNCNLAVCPVLNGYENPKPSTSKIDAFATQSGTVLAMDTDAEISDYSESEDNSASSGDEKFELNLGNELIAKLEEKFSDVGISYPRGFQPVVQIPINLARQLHALYIESCFQQLEAQNQVLQTIIKEDEELALKLHMEELKITDDNHETPNLKDIMDEQAAISIYQKEINELRKCTADDLATLLTKQKLKKSFPNVAEDTLMEIYQANDRNYTETVQCLVNSVSYTSNVQEPNLMEPPIEASVLQDMKIAQEFTPKSVMLNEKNHSPEEFRAIANKHLQARQELFEKANRYHREGIFPVAVFYSNLAVEQTKLFDQANALAASALLASNRNNSHTLDLHNLYVKEAINALDIFLDSHIEELQNSRKSNCYLHIITGRGNNSKNGIPKVRPAVMKQLRNRRLTYSIVNPGLLRVKLYKSKLGNV